MNRLKLAGWGALFALGLTLNCAPAGADEAADAGRKILAEHQGAVVTVRVVAKSTMSMPGRGSDERETKSEVTGTVIGADGLAVLALSETDPSSMFRMMGGRNPGFKVETEITDIKILLPDEKEIDAEVLLRDPDLDLVFIRPIDSPDEPMSHIDLSKSGEVETLDEVITLNRLGQVASRVYSASIERIEAVVERPRKFYIMGKDPTQTAMGSPAFSLSGEVVGVVVMRAVKTAGDAGGMQDAIASILLPADQVRDSAEQAIED